jgi:hypothetical protein
MAMMSSKQDGKSGSIPPSVSQQIDENLKRLYSEAAAEDLPSNLTKLLDALRQQETQSKSGDE